MLFKLRLRGKRGRQHRQKKKWQGEDGGKTEGEDTKVERRHRSGDRERTEETIGETTEAETDRETDRREHRGTHRSRAQGGAIQIWSIHRSSRAQNMSSACKRELP